MNKRASIDEIVSRRKHSAGADGELYKAVILEGEVAKAFDTEARSQRFTMSTENPDLYGDIVRQDGIKMENFAKNPVALAYHDHRAPIGWWKDVGVVKGRPKRTEGVLTLHAAGTTDKVDEIERLLSAGAIKACSIGFMPMEAEWILDAEGRNTYGLDFKQSALLECSVCSIPANPEALAKAAGGDMKLAAELFERVLDTYCEEKSGGLYVRKEFADLYKELRGNKHSRMAPKALENKVCETLVIDVDTKDAQEKIDGLLDHVRKGLASIFGAHEPEKTEPVDKWAEYRGKSLDDGWPMKFAAKSGDGVAFADGGDDVALVTFEGETAEYKVAGEDGDMLFLDFVKEIEPEPKAPEFVPGSRAKAKAELAKLRAAAAALT